MSIHQAILTEIYEELTGKLDHHLILYKEHPIGIAVIGKSGRTIYSIWARCDDIKIMNGFEDDSFFDYNDPEMIDKITNRLLEVLT